MTSLYVAVACTGYAAFGNTITGVRWLLLWRLLCWLWCLLCCAPLFLSKLGPAQGAGLDDAQPCLPVARHHHAHALVHAVLRATPAGSIMTMLSKPAWLVDLANAFVVAHLGPAYQARLEWACRLTTGGICSEVARRPAVPHSCHAHVAQICIQPTFQFLEAKMEAWPRNPRWNRVGWIVGKPTACGADRLQPAAREPLASAQLGPTWRKPLSCACAPTLAGAGAAPLVPLLVRGPADLPGDPHSFLRLHHRPERRPE